MVLMRSRFAFIAAIQLGTALVIWFHLLKFFNSFLWMPFDWEPTDGDHLNLIFRIQKGLPIYSNWQTGEVLNIYCPGYHYLVAALGLVFPTGLILGRVVSLLCFFGCVAMIFFSVATSRRPGEKGYSKYLIAALAAFSVTMIFFERILTDLVDLNPNMFYTLLALASVFALSLWERKKTPGLLILSSVLAFMALFTKQQGIWAFATGLAALSIGSRKKSEWIIYIGLFVLLSVGATIYLESVNDHSFLSSTVINLRKIYFSPMPDALKRIGAFALTNAQWFFIFIAGFIFSWRRHQLRIWQVSIPIQCALLLLTVGNGAGGPNYFFSLWCSLVISCGISVVDFVIDQSWTKKLSLRLFAGIICAIIAYQAYFMVFFISAEIDKLTDGTKDLAPLMTEYYEAVAKLVNESPNKDVLVDRSIGAYILSGARVGTEFCAMSHAWVSGDSDFNREALLDKIRNKKFAVITTGMEPIRLEIAKMMNTYYQPMRSFRINLWKGQRVETILIFTPRP